MNQNEAWYWLTNIEGIYNYDIKEILNVFDNPIELFEAKENEIRNSLKLAEDKINRILFSKATDIKGRMGKLEDNNIRFVCITDDDYPECFYPLEDIPYSIYVRGNLPDPLVPSVGIVGARACSGYGREHAFQFARKLAASNIQTISGMAVGIDSECARGTIKAGGKTFAVLGGGVDVIYPRENIELYYQIIETGGGIISEFAPGTPSIAWQFPYRNRLISAFSDRLLVIEAGLRSGTLSTAMHSLNLGKDVYALPGRLTDKQSQGCNRLIYDGAGMILDIDDFIDDLMISCGFKDKTEGVSSNINSVLSSSEEDGLLIYFKQEPVNAQVLSEISGLNLKEVKIMLSELEMDGLITKISGDYYVKRR